MVVELLEFRAFAGTVFEEYCEGGEMTAEEFFCFRVITTVMVDRMAKGLVLVMPDLAEAFLRRAIRAVQLPYPTGQDQFESKLAFQIAHEVLEANQLNFGDLAVDLQAPLYLQSRFG